MTSSLSHIPSNQTNEDLRINESSNNLLVNQFSPSNAYRNRRSNALISPSQSTSHLNNQSNSHSSYSQSISQSSSKSPSNTTSPVDGRQHHFSPPQSVTRRPSHSSEDVSSPTYRSSNNQSDNPKQSSKQANKSKSTRPTSRSNTTITNQPQLPQWNNPYTMDQQQPNNQTNNQSSASSVKSDSENEQSDTQYDNDQSPDQSTSASQAESSIAKKRRHAQIDASRRARETAIIEQLKTLSGQRAESVKRDRLESLEVAVERYSTLTRELPRLQRLVQRLTAAAQRQGLMEPNIDAESWLATMEQTQALNNANSITTPTNGSSTATPASQSNDQSNNQSNNQTINQANDQTTNQTNNQTNNQSTDSLTLPVTRSAYESDHVTEEDAEMYLTALSDLIRYRPFHSVLSTTQFVSMSVPLCAVRMRDARLTACNSAMMNRLQWRHEPEDVVGLQCVDLWYILGDIYRRVATIPFPALDNNTLLIQSTGVVSHTNRAETIQPLIQQPQSLVNEIIRLLSGLTDVIDVEFLAPASAIVAQKRRCRVWLTKGWQAMQISNVEMVFHLISITVEPVDTALLTPKRTE